MKTILAITHPTEKKILAGLTVLFFILVITYTYLIASTVFHVTARKNIQYQAQVSAAHVADLEASFLKESTQIARAAEGVTGLAPIQQKHFVRITPGRTLTLYDER